MNLLPRQYLYIVSLFLVSIVFESMFNLSYAQTDSSFLKRNPLNISFELAGNGVIWSVNLEKSLTKKKNLLNMRIGAEFLPLRISGPLEYRAIGILGEVSTLLGKSRNKFEAGLGVSYIYLYDNLQSNIFGDSADLFLLVTRLGYRFYSKNKRRYFKAAYTPLIVLDKNDGDDWDQSIIPFYLGVSYGFQLGEKKREK